MNERIRQLAEQAVKYSLSNVNRDSEFFTPIAMEKFAELIYKDILVIVGAQALSNHSALDVFKNLKRIYEVVEE